MIYISLWIQNLPKKISFGLLVHEEVSKQLHAKQKPKTEIDTIVSLTLARSTRRNGMNYSEAGIEEFFRLNMKNVLAAFF